MCKNNRIGVTKYASLNYLGMFDILILWIEGWLYYQNLSLFSKCAEVCDVFVLAKTAYMDVYVTKCHIKITGKFFM
jgi:hypothetical protein